MDTKKIKGGYIYKGYEILGGIRPAGKEPIQFKVLHTGIWYKTLKQAKESIDKLTITL